MSANRSVALNETPIRVAFAAARANASAYLVPAIATRFAFFAANSNACACVSPARTNVCVNMDWVRATSPVARNERLA